MDWLSSAVSTFLPVASGLTSGLFNLKATDKANQSNRESVRDTNAMNYQIAQETNALNRDIADRNIAFQRENLEYQKALQQQVFDREDTAYERTVQDMRNAGLSPLSMSGTNGAGSVISTSAPNDNMQYMAPTMQSYQAQSASGAFDSAMTSLNQISQQLFQRDSMKAQARLTNAEAEKQEIENQYAHALYRYDLLSRTQNFRNMDYELRNKVRNFYHNVEYGFYDGQTSEERQASILAHTLGLTGTNTVPGFEYDIKHGPLGFYSTNDEDWYHPSFGDFNSKKSQQWTDRAFSALLLASGLNDVLGHLNIGSIFGDSVKNLFVPGK